MVMTTAWERSINLAKHPDGTIRSILGYAGESIVIGRALVSGYNLFFKAWRDSPYDAVLEYDGILYRIEIKQSGAGQELSLTGGGRSGAQISRSVESREHVVSTEDCDLLIGVHSLSGKCWVIPAEVLEILNRTRADVDAFRDFEESWAIFTNAPSELGPERLRTRLRKKTVAELETLAHNLGIALPAPDWHSYATRTKVEFTSDIDKLAFAIWTEVGRRGKV